jgi:peroxidase
MFALILIAAIAALTFTHAQQLSPLNGSITLYGNEVSKAGIKLASDIGTISSAPSINERYLSNLLFADKSIGKVSAQYSIEDRRYGTNPNKYQVNMLFALFGQFVMHDISHTRIGFCSTPGCLTQIEIKDPMDQLYMVKYPEGYPEYMNNYPKSRLFTFPSIGEKINGTFYGYNDASSILDAEVIYSNDENILSKLRENYGGRMKLVKVERIVNGVKEVSNELPNILQTSVPNDCSPSPVQFSSDSSSAGDTRSDVSPTLLAIHTIWVRYHNYIADRFASEHPTWDNDKLFWETRKYVKAVLQHITYDEFLPKLIGQTEVSARLGRYFGYKRITPTTSTAFAVGAGRMGHSMVNLPLLALDSSCK